jgi:hypothetical protein
VERVDGGMALSAKQNISPKTATPKGKKGAVATADELESMKNGDCQGKHEVGLTFPAPRHCRSFCGNNPLQLQV